MPRRSPRETLACSTVKVRVQVLRTSAADAKNGRVCFFFLPSVFSLFSDYFFYYYFKFVQIDFKQSKQFVHGILLRLENSTIFR